MAIKPDLSKDGNNRATIAVYHRISGHEIATSIAYRGEMECEALQDDTLTREEWRVSYREWLATLTKKQTEEWVREDLHERGATMWALSDRTPSWVLEASLDRVRELYPTIYAG